MNNRIKELRNTLNLTLDDFGQKIGVQSSAVSKLEHGRTSLTEQTIKLICAVTWPGGRKVSEIWLRTGEGDMFEQLSTEDELIRCLTEIQHRDPTDMQLRFIKAVAKLPPGKWGVIEDLMIECAGVGDDELPAPRDL